MNKHTESQPDLSIVVTNWNGEKFLGDCLSTLWKSGQASGRPFELIVVDDVSSDNSVSLIEREFPRVRLIENSKNLGFAGTSNKGAQEARGRILVMMNNDMKAPEEFIRNLVAPFFVEHNSTEPPLFAVGAKTVDWVDGKPNHLCMDAAWRRGGIGAEWSDPKERCVTVFPQGGSAAFDRGLYLRLGGFDPLFYPTYWDDYDLSYRACKCGWRVYYEPSAVADHLGKATLKRQVRLNRMEQIVERNRLWFNWLNLEDPMLIGRHILALPWIYARDLFTGKGINGFLGFFRALGGICKVWRLRQNRRKTDPAYVLTDRDLLKVRLSKINNQ